MSPEVIAAIVASVLAIVASLITGLVAWGWRGQINTLRAEFQAALAKAALEFYERVNGHYVKKESCSQRCGANEGRLEQVEGRVKDLGG